MRRLDEIRQRVEVVRTRTNLSKCESHYNEDVPYLLERLTEAEAALERVETAPDIRMARSTARAYFAAQEPS